MFHYLNKLQSTVWYRFVFEIARRRERKNRLGGFHQNRIADIIVAGSLGKSLECLQRICPVLVNCTLVTCCFV